MSISRCIWANAYPLYIKYHDEEWGVPIRQDDQKLFEALVLEQMQAKFSKLIILEKQENFRTAFSQYDPESVARYTDTDIERLASDKRIVRHRPKIEAVVYNARAILDVQAEFGSFDTFIWQFVSNQPVQNSWKTLNELPLSSAESEAMSKEMKKRKFRQVNPEVCYSYMQAIGMVNDHFVDCFRYHEVAKLQGRG